MFDYLAIKPKSVAKFWNNFTKIPSPEIYQIPLKYLHNMSEWVSGWLDEWVNGWIQIYIAFILKESLSFVLLR